MSTNVPRVLTLVMNLAIVLIQLAVSSVFASMDLQEMDIIAEVFNFALLLHSHEHFENITEKFQKY